MQKNSKIYVAGHRGMVGSAIVRELQKQGYTNIITRTHKELDLTQGTGPDETGTGGEVFLRREAGICVSGSG